MTHAEPVMNPEDPKDITAEDTSADVADVETPTRKWEWLPLDGQHDLEE